MPSVYAVKGTKCYCVVCGDHLLTFKYDANIGDPIHEALFEPGNQGEFKYASAMQCRKCGARFQFNPENIILRPPEQ